MPRAKNSKRVVYWKGKTKRIDYPIKGDLRHDILRYFYRYTPNQIAEKTGVRLTTIVNAINLMMEEGSLPSLKDFSEKEFFHHRIPSAHLEKASFKGLYTNAQKPQKAKRYKVERKKPLPEPKVEEREFVLRKDDSKFKPLRRPVTTAKLLLSHPEDYIDLVDEARQKGISISRPEKLYKDLKLSFQRALKAEKGRIKFNNEELSEEEIEQMARANLKKWGIAPEKK